MATGCPHPGPARLELVGEAREGIPGSPIAHRCALDTGAGAPPLREGTPSEEEPRHPDTSPAPVWGTPGSEGPGPEAQAGTRRPLVASPGPAPAPGSPACGEETVGAILGVLVSWEHRPVLCPHSPRDPSRKQQPSVPWRGASGLPGPPAPASGGAATVHPGPPGGLPSGPVGCGYGRRTEGGQGPRACVSPACVGRGHQQLHS